jgi:folate-binding protein YgfZ
MAGLFETLTGAAAASRDLGDRGTLQLTGVDRVRFLNGMLSNDVAKLGPGETCYAMLLNRKGRILADLFVLALDDGLLLDTAPGTHAEVGQVLERHIIADDVAIHDLSEAWGQVGLEGPGVRSVLESESMPLPVPGRFVRAERGGETFLWVGGGSLTPEGLQVLGPRAPLARLVAGLGLPGVSEKEVEVLRIEGFLPVYGIDMTEQNSPVEARLEHAVSYTKGCFVGQEILARPRCGEALVGPDPRRGAGRTRGFDPGWRHGRRRGHERGGIPAERSHGARLRAQFRGRAGDAARSGGGAGQGRRTASGLEPLVAAAHGLPAVLVAREDQIECVLHGVG